ncbi:MAG: moaA 2 [Firmicutes bacterium]|nr:moaA 2 [Bacillota bacterium]
MSEGRNYRLDVYKQYGDASFTHYWFGGVKVESAHKRVISYLRVSVTDRCNFRCAYCMPYGIKWLNHSDILSYEELLRLISVFAGEGIANIRLTGGEPLVRRDIVDFVSAITKLRVVKDLSMTTNGSLLPVMAQKLKAAGLDRVNISLDTVNRERFAKVTACGRLEDTLRGVESALAAGLTPVKLNVVLTDALKESDLAYFIELTDTQPISVRFIEYMPIGGKVNSLGPDIEGVKKLLEALGHGKLVPADSAIGSGPARYYRLNESIGTFGFITPISDHFCSACNRLRLTADGKLKPCLLSDNEVDLKTPLRSGASDVELARLFQLAVEAKPEGHSLCRSSGYPEFQRKMSQIGG